MNLILLASLALTAIGTPTGEEIFQRSTASLFCKSAKVGCANTEEKAVVQNFCSSYLSLAPRKTKTFIDLETSLVYTATQTTTLTTYIESYSGAPNTHTSWATVTDPSASTSLVTTTVDNGAASIFPTQCGGAVRSSTGAAIAPRDTAVQPACFSKDALKTKMSSACSCFTLTATIPATSLIDTTTTISTASTASVTTTVYGPVVVTSTTTISEVTSTTTVSSNQATVSAFALMDGPSGLYAEQNAEITSFSTNAAGAASFTLDSDGVLSFGSGYYAGDGTWQFISSSPDFIRFENESSFAGTAMNEVGCSISSASGQCSLVCSVNGWSENCLYQDGSSDGRDGGWILAPSGMGFCTYTNPPLIMPLPS